MAWRRNCFVSGSVHVLADFAGPRNLSNVFGPRDVLLCNRTTYARTELPQDYIGDGLDVLSLCAKVVEC